jgi:alkyl hydroperoxide reductase subunit AhpC
MDEILRLVDAMQTSDEHNVATPANREIESLFQHRTRRRW